MEVGAARSDLLAFRLDHPEAIPRPVVRGHLGERRLVAPAGRPRLAIRASDVGPDEPGLERRLGHGQCARDPGARLLDVAGSERDASELRYQPRLVAEARESLLHEIVGALKTALVRHEIGGNEPCRGLRRLPAFDLLDRRGVGLLEPLRLHQFGDTLEARALGRLRGGVVDVPSRVDRERRHPLHAAWRVDDEQLHRRLPRNRLRLLVPAHRDAALVVCEHDFARQHREERAPVLEDLHFPVGPPDGGRRRRRLEVEVRRRAVGLRPAPALLQPEDRRILGRKGSRLDLQQRLFGEAHLCAVAEKEPHATVGGGPHVVGVKSSCSATAGFHGPVSPVRLSPWPWTLTTSAARSVDWAPAPPADSRPIAAVHRNVVLIAASPSPRPGGDISRKTHKQWREQG